MAETHIEGRGIRTLIVDDEPLARELLGTMLREEPDIEIVGERGDGPSAIEAIEELAPDLLFLDIQIPGIDGFGVLRAIDPERMPVVIFVTAYDHYAIRAFDVHALDYLLKPFDEERLARGVERARRTIGRRKNGDSGDDRLLDLLREMRPERSYIERLAIREKTRIFLQPVREIGWVEADGKYIHIHTGNATYTIRDGIGRLHAELDPRKFIRISRSAIVNVEEIRELRPWFQGDYLVVLNSGKQIPSTRGYREALQGLIDGRG